VIERRIAWSELIGSGADDAVEPGAEWRMGAGWRTVQQADSGGTGASRPKAAARLDEQASQSLDDFR